MRLPVWMYSGSDVFYVFSGGMEVYKLDGSSASYKGTKPSHDVSKMHRLYGPWLERMESMRRIRIQF